MNQTRNDKDRQTGKPLETEQFEGDPSYPAPIEKMSEKWRILKRRGSIQDPRSFFERHYLALGIFFGLLIIALLVVGGGFAFLVWNARQ
jgi:hypothetical protein